MTDASKGWLEARERGGVLAIRVTVFIATVLGRTFGRFVALFVALYFTITSPGVRRAIRGYYERLGRAASFATVYRHLLRFVHCTLDAFFFVSGKIGSFEITCTGDHYLAALRDQKKGAILIGAHVGSLYAMRAQSTTERLPLYALVYTKNARMLNEALEQLDPDGAAHLVELDPEGGLDSMLRVRELLEQGAIVAIMGDRVPSGGRERVVRAPFLGAEASFPAGPFMLASMLKAPVYLTFGLSRGSRGYDLFCEPFADRIELPRKDREAALQSYVARYADRLEHYVKKAPDNWFNFYDFWAPATKREV
jgi:predicted LPLAT superfamily acyltransferase